MLEAVGTNENRVKI